MRLRAFDTRRLTDSTGLNPTGRMGAGGAGAAWSEETGIVFFFITGGADPDLVRVMMPELVWVCTSDTVSKLLPDQLQEQRESGITDWV